MGKSSFISESKILGACPLAEKERGLMRDTVDGINGIADDLLKTASATRRPFSRR